MVKLNEKILYDTIRKCKVVKTTIMHEGNRLPTSYTHPENCDVVFKFQFTTMNLSTDAQGPPYRVYAFNREDMDLFLRQHGFDIRYVHVEFIPINEFDDDEEHILKLHKFRSNTSNEVYHIMTTSRFVDDAIDYTCLQLTDHLILGPPIVRNDIEIIKLINELMYSLPYVFILDHTLTDGFGGDVYSGDWEKYIKFYDSEQSLENMDDSYIYESMHNSSVIDKMQPITIEAYVSHFTQMLFDSFNDEPF